MAHYGFLVLFCVIECFVGGEERRCAARGEEQASAQFTRYPPARDSAVPPPAWGTFAEEYQRVLAELSQEFPQINGQPFLELLAHRGELRGRIGVTRRTMSPRLCRKVRRSVKVMKGMVRPG